MNDDFGPSTDNEEGESYSVPRWYMLGPDTYVKAPRDRDVFAARRGVIRTQTFENKGYRDQALQGDGPRQPA